MKKNGEREEILKKEIRKEREGQGRTPVGPPCPESLSIIGDHDRKEDTAGSLRPYCLSQTKAILGDGEQRDRERGGAARGLLPR